MSIQGRDWQERLRLEMGAARPHQTLPQKNAFVRTACEPASAAKPTWELVLCGACPS